MDNIVKNGSGIIINYANNNFVIGNTVYNATYGIGFSSSFYNTIVYNHCYNNKWSEIDGFQDGSASLIAHNRLHGNDAGIYLDVCGGNQVIDNKIYNNNAGIGVADITGYGNIIRDNTISQNQIGVTVTNTNLHEIYNNNLMNNVLQVKVYRVYGENPFYMRPPIGGNYWSDWTGPDNNNDGFVDVPYFVGINMDGIALYDEYPLVNPIRKDVTIDIDPCFKPNIIDRKFTWALIPVAILSKQGFDAPNMIDQASLTFGNDGDEKSLAFCSLLSMGRSRDKARDLICFFYIGKFGFQCGDTKGILRGKTYGGTPIEGSDTVKIVPCK